MTRPKPQDLLGWTAMLCWVAAWFLPVMDGYSGWSAFRAALLGPFRESFPVRGEAAALQMLSALTNLAFVLLFVAWWRGRVSRPALYLKIALACLLVNSYWLVEMLRAGERDVLLAGYYLWLAAFALLTALGAVIAAATRRASGAPTDGTPA